MIQTTWEFPWATSNFGGRLAFFVSLVAAKCWTAPKKLRTCSIDHQFSSSFHADFMLFRWNPPPFSDASTRDHRAFWSAGNQGCRAHPPGMDAWSHRWFMGNLGFDGELPGTSEESLEAGFWRGFWCWWCHTWLIWMPDAWPCPWVSSPKLCPFFTGNVVIRRSQGFSNIVQRSYMANRT